MPRGDHLDPFGVDGAGEHRSSGGAIASHIGGLGRDFLNHLRAHVFEFVFELDFLRDRHAVLGHGRCAKAFFEHNIAALGAQGHDHGIGQNVDAS